MSARVTNGLATAFGSVALSGALLFGLTGTAAAAPATQPAASTAAPTTAALVKSDRDRHRDRDRYRCILDRNHEGRYRDDYDDDDWDRDDGFRRARYNDDDDFRGGWFILVCRR
jgi:hypothetical protein